MADKSGKIKRQKRFIKHCEIEFLSNGVIHKGISSNFSIKGFFVKTDHPPAPDSILDAVIHLPDGSTSRLKAKIKRISGRYVDDGVETSEDISDNGIGVEIIERDANYLNFIRSLLP